MEEIAKPKQKVVVPGKKVGRETNIQKKSQV